jgi:hypothetical protein
MTIVCGSPIVRQIFIMAFENPDEFISVLRRDLIMQKEHMPQTTFMKLFSPENPCSVPMV